MRRNEFPGGENTGKPKAVFFDKDGTLVVNVPYNVTPDLIRLAKEAPLCLRILHEAGYRFIVVSNQSGVARGYYGEEALAPVWQRLAALFDEIGVPLLGAYYCPHHPEGVVPSYAVPCSCRKPAPDLLLRAAFDHDLDLMRSWMIGDILDDVEAGFRAGCKTVLVDSGGETEWRLAPDRMPDVFTTDLAQAAFAILSASNVEERNSSSQEEA